MRPVNRRPSTLDQGEDPMIRKVILITLLFLPIVSICIAFSSAQANKPLLMRMPTVSRTQIAFTYAVDLWIVNREGAEANRLTTCIGTETTPLFTPDGKT